MKKIIIEEFFNFKEMGLHGTVRADQNYPIKTGDIIQDQNGNIYKILAIGFPCSITAREFLLRLEKQ